jgi:hypothetical protein
MLKFVYFSIFLTFAFQNGLKRGSTLLPLLFNFALKYAIRKVQDNQWIGLVCANVSLLDININILATDTMY